MNKLIVAAVSALFLVLIGKPVMAAGDVQAGSQLYDTLSDALSNTAEGGTITLRGNTTVNNTLILDRGFTLNLNGYTLTGPASGQLFFVGEGKKVTIMNGTLTDPDNASGSSDLIRTSQNSILSLEGVRVTDRNGSAINAGYAALNLTNCNITGHQFGIKLRNSTLSADVNNSISSSGSFDSVGIQDDGGSRITITEGTVSSSGTALEAGGSSILTLTDTVLTSKNISGIRLHGTQAQISGCTIKGPHAVGIGTDNPTGAYISGTTVRSSVTMTKCTISGGSGIQCLNSNLDLKGCSITASAVNACGINAYSTMPASEKMTVTLDGSTVSAFAIGAEAKDCILNITGKTKITSEGQSSGDPAGVIVFNSSEGMTGELNIMESTVSGPKGIRADGGAVIRIGSGTVTGTKTYGIELGSGVLDISGGTVEKSIFISKPSDSSLSVSGGTFRGSYTREIYTNGTFPKGFVTGGLFEKGQVMRAGNYTDALGADSIAAGYSAVPAQQAGYYRVVKGKGDAAAQSGTGKVSDNSIKILSSSTAALTKAENKKTVSVPSTVTVNGKNYKIVQIEANAFQGNKIRSVTIGNHVTTIKANAFKGSKATKVTIGKNVRKIEAKAFNQSVIKTLVVKSKKLNKASAVRQCFKGCKSAKITVRFGSAGKKYVNKSFTAKNTKARKIVLKK